MLKKRAYQLLKQRQNANDKSLIDCLIGGFELQSDGEKFHSFEIPLLYSKQQVQSVLNQIDSRLYVTYSTSGGLSISIKE